MSLEGYLRNIQAKTGLAPADFRLAAEQQGFAVAGKLRDGVKAGAIVDWLKRDYGLGHGHAMAIVALLKGANASS